jgi:type I restriction enzyme S subunit
LGRGATFKEISKRATEQIPIPVPPIEEQERIVAELDLLQGIIEKKKEQLKAYDQLAQSIFYSMFGDPIDNPKGWEVTKLKDITTKIGSGATPKGGNQSYKNEGISLIRSLNVHNGSFKYEDLAHIDEQQAHQLNNVIVEENDVLFNITGASVARCCIVPFDVLPARVNQHVSILRPKKEIVNHVYLCYYLISPNSQNALLVMSKSNAATREALPKSMMEKYSICVPPLSLQQEFAEKVEAIERQKALVQQSIEETQTMFDCTMDKYFG